MKASKKVRWGLGIALVAALSTLFMWTKSDVHPSASGDAGIEGGAVAQQRDRVEPPLPGLTNQLRQEVVQEGVGSTGVKRRVVNGVVVTSAGVGIEGALVVERGDVAAAVRTDEMGRFSMEVPDRQWLNGVELLAKHSLYGACVRRVEHAVLDGGSIVELRMQSGSVMRVTVVDERSVPIADAWLEAWLVKPGLGRGIVIGGRDSREMSARARTLYGGHVSTITTDAYGQAVLGGLGAGSYGLTVSCDEYCALTVEAIAVNGFDEIDLGKLTLVAGRRLMGSVAVASGEPGRGAEIELITRSSEVLPDYKVCKADEEGRFSIGGLGDDVEKVDMRVSLDGWGSVYREDVEVGMGAVRIEMPVLEKLKMRLVGLSGDHLRNGYVSGEWVASSGLRRGGGGRRNWLATAYAPKGLIKIKTEYKNGVVEAVVEGVPRDVDALEVVCDGYYRGRVRVAEWREAGEAHVAMIPGYAAVVRVQGLGAIAGGERITITIGEWRLGGVASYTQIEVPVDSVDGWALFRVDPSEVAWEDGVSVLPAVEGLMCPEPLTIKQGEQSFLDGRLAIEMTRR